MPIHLYVYFATSLRLLRQQRIVLCVLRIRMSVLRPLREVQLEGDSKGRHRDCILPAMLDRHRALVGDRALITDLRSADKNSLFLGLKQRSQGVDFQVRARPAVKQAWTCSDLRSGARQKHTCTPKGGFATGSTESRLAGMWGSLRSTSWREW